MCSGLLTQHTTNQSVWHKLAEANVIAPLYLPHLSLRQYYHYHNQDETMAKIIVNPNHDIVLRLNGYDLLVSSKVLSLASPVFEAMFKPHFKEGVEHHLRLGEPHIIPLPEDDPEATTLFCQITHHRSRDLPRTPSPLCLENLAIFCNKYICAGSVVGYGTLWIQRHSGSQSLEDLSRLLLLAFVLDLPESFATVSREMLLLRSGLFTSLWIVDNHPVTHGDLLGM
jgi:hypothetical protein